MGTPGALALDPNAKGFRRSCALEKSTPFSWAHSSSPSDVLLGGIATPSSRIHKVLGLMGLGACTEVAAEIAANTRRWWRNSGMLLNSILDLKWDDRLKIPRLR
jgi:hypothetical protein